MPPSDPKPPAWAIAVLQKVCPQSLYEGILGDLLEQYAHNYRAKGERRANRLFLTNILFFIRPGILKRHSKLETQTNSIMISNYFKVAYRNIVRHKFYSLLNIFGLAFGLATFLLIYFYIEDELIYDNYHEKKDRIYRIVSDLKTPDRDFSFALTPPKLAERLKGDFAGIEHTSRFSRTGGLVSYQDKRFQENNVYYAESSAFATFSWEVIAGNSAEFLSLPYQIVLDQPTAEKYFGKDDPIGKRLSIAGFPQDFEVTGIIKPIPTNSHFTFDILISFETSETFFDANNDRWFYLDYFTYLLLKPEQNPQEIISALPEFTLRHIGETQDRVGQYYTFFMQPLKNIYLKSSLDNENGTRGNLNYIYLFSAVAVFILVIACINFINLATAQSQKRGKEVGMRKSVGASKNQLLNQFLSESLLITFFALIVAVGICYFLLPAFNDIAGKKLGLDLFSWQKAILLVGLVLGVGLISGIYPGVILARFKPARVLKAQSKTGTGSGGLRQGLVVFQLTISIALIIATIAVSQQLKKIKNQNLGFDHEQIVNLQFRMDQNFRSNQGGRDFYETVKRELAQSVNAVAASAVRTSPDVDPPNWYSEFEDSNGEMQNTSINGYIVDYDFLDTYDIDLVAGRFLSRDILADTSGAFILNEAAVKFFGFATPEEALDKKFFQIGIEGKIIGVVQDFNFKSLHQQIEPLAIYYYPNFFNRFSIKLPPGNHQAALQALESKWNELVPQQIFTYTFLDQGLADRYQAEQQIGNIFSKFSMLSILIACLGLVGLSSFIAEQRRKEVGIRKVLGATTSGILTLFSKGFVKLTLIAFLFSAPIAYYALERWLEAFPYRISLEPWIFLLAGSIALVATVATIGLQTLRSALAKPVDSLRYE